LNGTLTRIDGELSSVGAPVLANADAETLAHVLASLGFTVTADRLNVGLMILAVIILEMGGGLSLAVASALRGPTLAQPTYSPGASAIIPPVSVPVQHIDQDAQSTVAPLLTSAPNTERQATEENAREPITAVSIGGATPHNETTRAKVLQLITDAGGHVRLDQRSLARTLGVAPSTVNRAIAALQADGVVTKRSGATGSVLALA
jgi:biotin operon repressor